MNWDLYLSACIIWAAIAMWEYNKDVGYLSCKILIAGIVNFIFFPIIVILRLIDLVFNYK